ncbi:TIGR01212 family radical SAM protein [Fusibacter bizertensis]|jgi:radical SAM protein, TIGR01212 family|uniref:TIGR01212 family radical SAM protein n=1 Tax=Fusibacter bizertensis TaxID=1488331 RepID=A0ABT6NEP5_9FIRM|nr:TIGR01212 family radical SAM protein [Fusibacter bizertensis]MDH8678889.1 TIGR01212 family radical SAM protein [Fusibacter bizertensis]
MNYRKYSEALKDKYGEKVYKIPINLPISCPNRDGRIGTGGCIFCGEIGTGFEAQSSILSVKEQLHNNIEIISPKYNAHKFIAYFQNYTNTYMALDAFEKVLNEACIENIIGISVSTRPDCISKPYLEVLKAISMAKKVDIEIELGLQSVNVNTLEIINRGHGLAEFIEAVLLIKSYGFTICTHLIGNLPWDTERDFYEGAKLINVLGVDSVKVHSLYILKDTILGTWYENDAFDMISPETYIDRVIHFLRLLKPTVVVQRLFGRAPEEDTLFCNWEMSWRKLQNQLDSKMTKCNYMQGDLYTTEKIVSGGQI